jgi:hypothetical protein
MNETMIVIGYDPGGNNRHGVAVVSVLNDGHRWVPRSLDLQACANSQAVIDLISAKAPEGQLLAAGIDTLTAWSSGDSGWRLADLRLRKKYKEVLASVDNPNHINGSMCLNGALLLRWLSQRADKGGAVTEAHPKVLYYALRKQRHPWSDAGDAPAASPADAARWLIDECGILEYPQDLAGSLASCDHKFDALLGALSALRGLNKEWTTDLHANADAVHPFGQTHYWWPENIPQITES